MSVLHNVDGKYVRFKVGLKKREKSADGYSQPKGMIYTFSNDGKTIYGAPTVTLSVGTTYEFDIDTPGHPFYITTDPTGGGAHRNPPKKLTGAIAISHERPGNRGIQKDVLTWKPEMAHVTMELFYQCDYHPLMGGVIKVVIPRE